LRSSIEKRATALGIGSMLTLLGWQDGSAVLNELRDARGFVLPSFAEGLPVVLMEALGAARPVVTTYVAGIPELVRNDENGWLVPAGASRELARAMRELLETRPSKLTEMGIRGAKRVGQLHDSRISAMRLGELIQSNLDGRSPEAECLSELNDLVGLE
jgi:glycosyltransferase involved in cell wall biosynthesis